MFELTKEAFTLQSKIFDKYEEQNDILKWMRSVTRRHVMKHLRKEDRILELNAGTGLDAVYFVENGYKIDAIDISEGMIEKLKQKIDAFNLQDKISCEILSFTELNKLYGQSYNYIFSNFGGLNCVDDLSKVTKHFRKLLNPDGRVTLVIMPPICPWEIALILKGNLRTAFRRLYKNGIDANIEGVKFQTFYHSYSDIKKAMGKDFRLIELQGLASISPPPYMENFPKRHRKLHRSLCSIDERISNYFPFNKWADHIIATFQLRNPN